MRPQEVLDTIRKMENIFRDEIELRSELNGWIAGKYLGHIQIGQRLTRTLARLQVPMCQDVGKPRRRGDAQQEL
jgi:hypothetical protein